MVVIRAILATAPPKISSRNLPRMRQIALSCQQTRNRNIFVKRVPVHPPPAKFIILTLGLGGMEQAGAGNEEHMLPLCNSLAQSNSTVSNLCGNSEKNTAVLTFGFAIAQPLRRKLMLEMIGPGRFHGEAVPGQTHYLYAWGD
jgi:hypothetical protein